MGCFVFLSCYWFIWYCWLLWYYWLLYLCWLLCSCLLINCCESDVVIYDVVNVELLKEVLLVAFLVELSDSVL